MDEVDGMAGNEDRGGVAELINLIKATKVPMLLGVFILHFAFVQCAGAKKEC